MLSPATTGAASLKDESQERGHVGSPGLGLTAQFPNLEGDLSAGRVAPPSHLQVDAKNCFLLIGWL